jgi:hypothetical protein
LTEFDQAFVVGRGLEIKRDAALLVVQGPEIESPDDTALVIAEGPVACALLAPGGSASHLRQGLLDLSTHELTLIAKIENAIEA